MTSHPDNFRLDGKVALVTGSGRGIGAAIAIELGKRGAKVVVNYSHSAGAAQKVVDTIKANGTDAIAIKADVGEIDQVAKMMDEAVEHFGQLDIVSSNAGLVSFGHMKDVSGDVSGGDIQTRSVRADLNVRNSIESFESTLVASSLSQEKHTDI